MSAVLKLVPSAPVAVPTALNTPLNVSLPDVPVRLSILVVSVRVWTAFLLIYSICYN
jgi:hypothetical protein